MNPADHMLRPRRQFLWDMGAGFAGLALTSLLDADGFFGSKAQAKGANEQTGSPLLPKPSHLPTRAKSCIFLFMFGGPSQVDTFDYKPLLQKRAGEAVPDSFKTEGKLYDGPFKWKQHGKSGLWVSDLYDNVATRADELCVIRSRYQQSAFVWALGIAIRAYRERLALKRGGWEARLVGPETKAMLEAYLHPFILMLLCEADDAEADRWVEGFRNVDVGDLREKCMRKAANEFDVCLRGFDIR